ncbi:FAD/NAD(P)-binding domain-containing protein [Cadophora sp. DSE1049]|nr:FAD/NAD(P)-binding domain-containing protein [Cadophora sp. DSE1049]
MARGFDDIPGGLPSDKIPKDFDISTVAFNDLTERVLDKLSESELDESALWRDHFSLAGAVRTFYGRDRIKNQWSSYSRERLPHSFKAGRAMVLRPTPDSSWIDVSFTFLTIQRGDLVGNCSGTASFIPSESSQGWKLWMLKTVLENFEGFGSPDDPSPIFKEPEVTAEKDEQLEHEVAVLVVGAGQNGLSVAGRLGALGISYILLEKAPTIGFSWTGKYDAVRQHTVKEMNNLPFDRTYKASDPTLLPAKIVAEGFQNYVQKYRINIWLAAKVESCLKSSGSPGWVVKVRKGEQEHVIKARHIVLSMGASQSVPNYPEIENASSFTGTILNIGSFKNSSPWKGKKAIVVGSATGAHDVAQDMLDYGVGTVTMIQREKTPIFPVEWIVAGQSTIYNLQIPPQMADRIAGTEPHKVSREILKINFKIAQKIEKERFDALERVGFYVDRERPLNDGVILRLGGYYIDVGTSARVAKGDIKVKSRDPIKRFVENGLEFESGDVVEADLVVFATGYQRDPRLQAASIVGAEVAQSMRSSKGFDEDGELDGIMMPSYPYAWLMGGAVSMARWNSRFIALQIQAELMGHPFLACQWDKTEGGSELGTKL